jgi:hypothetical protein
VLLPRSFPPAARADLAKLLHIDVDELPWTLPLVADRRCGRPVKVAQTGDPVAAKHSVDHGCWVAECGTKVVRTEPEPATSRKDPPHIARAKRPGAADGC